MNRVRRVTAVLLTLAATGLATTAQQSPAGAVTPAERSAAPATTSLTLHVSGCDRCSLTLQHAVSGNPTVWTSRTRRVGADHRVTFQVRTSRTHGLSFVIRAPWQGNTGAVSNVVTRYGGTTVGSAVTRPEARHAARAAGCWAGTRTDSARLRFVVSKVRARTLDGQPTHLPLAYAAHSLRSWRPVVHTFKGTIGNQDAFYCTKP